MINIKNSFRKLIYFFCASILSSNITANSQNIIQRSYCKKGFIGKKISIESKESVIISSLEEYALTSEPITKQLLLANQISKPIFGYDNYEIKFSHLIPMQLKQNDFKNPFNLQLLGVIITLNNNKNNADSVYLIKDSYKVTALVNGKSKLIRQLLDSICN